MLRKILVLILTCLILVSCTARKEETELVPIVEEETAIEEVVEEEIIVEPEVASYSNWSYVGEGEYNSDLAYKTIFVGSDDEKLISPDLYLYENTNYRISFNIASIKETKIKLKVFSSEETFLDEEINLSDNYNNCNFTFLSKVESYDTKIQFEIIDSAENVIQIDDFSLSSDTNKRTIKTNQIGYLTNLNKKIVTNQNQGDYFKIYNANDEVVYTSKLSKVVYNKDSNEYLQYGNFDDFNLEGSYYIKTELGSYSNNITIANSAYDNLAKDALNFIYTQRCGQTIEDDEVYHEACHTNNTKIYTFLGDYYIDTTGGWHDASDYGRYVQTTTKTIADLLIAYLYVDDKDEAILNEARYGVEWLLKLQKEDGSVYNKITTRLFAENILPENDKAEMYAMWAWTLTTASFAGIVGLAYEIYKDSDEEFANKCLAAQQKAIAYLQANKDLIQELNPDDFGTGEYRDTNESDERLFAYAVAYEISKDETYYELCKEVIDDGLANNDKNYNMRIYAIMTLLNCLSEDDALYEKAKASLLTECDTLVETANNNVYSYTYDNYNWGSNSHLCDACNKLLLAYKLFGEAKYLEAASDAINYVMGLNSLNLCFIYGYGYKYPNTIHHRVSNIRKTLPTGAMAAGVDEIMSEGVISKYLSEDTPIAKRFVDSSDSYTNVEPAIYYNSSLVLALKLLNETNYSK